MAEKIPHYLRPIKSSSGPSQLCTVDIRLDSSGKPYIFAIFERRELYNWRRRSEYAGTSPTDFWAWFWSRGQADRSTWLLSENWPRIALPIELPDETSTGRSTVLNGSLTDNVFWVLLSRGNRKCELIDIHNILYNSPVNCGQCRGDNATVGKLAMLTATSLHDIAKSLISRSIELDLGIVSPMIGSWAMSVWQHWQTGKYICVHCDENATRLERKAMYGGECRVNRIGEYIGPFYGVDANHLYSAAMSQWQYPYHLVKWQPDSSIAELEDLDTGMGAIASVRIRSDSRTYPIRHLKHTVYATGDFWTTLAWPELSIALHYGDIADVGECCLYYCDDLFSAWAKKLWQLRSTIPEGRKAPLGTLIKLLAVALHGRFGQHPVEWTDADSSAMHEWSTWIEYDVNGRHSWHRSIGDKAQVQCVGSSEPFNSFPAIAAWTTSAGRVAMTEYRSIAGEENVYYQYVDMLVVNQEGLDRLSANGCISSDKLGALKIDGQAKVINIRGPGWIQCDEELRASGIGRNAVKLGLDRYNIIHRTSPSGILSGSGLSAYVELPIETNYPPQDVIGEVDETGRVTPTRLVLSADYLDTGQSTGIIRQANADSLDQCNAESPCPQFGACGEYTDEVPF